VSSQHREGGYDDATAPMSRDAINDHGQYGGGAFQGHQSYGVQQYGPPQMYGQGYGSAGYGRGGGFGRRSSGEAVETRPFFVTSEFVGTLLAIIGVAITGAVIDGLEVGLTWILITALVAGYVLSRGIAKSGTRSRSFDPREELLRPELFQRHDSGGQRTPQSESAQSR